MIICSCKIISSNTIKTVIESQQSPTIQSILKEIKWKGECGICSNNLVIEINNQLSRR